MNRRKKARHTPNLDEQNQPAAAREDALLPAITGVPGVETKPLYLETETFRVTLREMPLTQTRRTDSRGSGRSATRLTSSAGKWIARGDVARRRTRRKGESR